MDARMLFLIQARNEASKDLRQLQNDIGSVVKSTAQQTVDVGGDFDVSGLVKQFSTLDGAVGAVASSIPVVGGALAGLGLASVAVQLGTVGAQSLRMSAAFDVAAKRAGLMGDQVLAALQKASNGTISDQSLRQSATRALGLGVADEVSEFTQLMEVARAKAAETGQSVAEAFDFLVTGIGRASPEILDNVNIVLNGQQVFDQYAASIGKTAEQLDQAERKQAVLNAVLAQGAGGMDATVAAAAESAEAIERLGASWDNLKTQMGESFAPIMAAAFDALASGLDTVNEVGDALGGEFAVKLGEIDGQIVQLTARINELRDAQQYAPGEGVNNQIALYRDQIVMLEQARNQLLGNADAAATVEGAWARIGQVTVKTKDEAWAAASAWKDLAGATTGAAAAQSAAAGPIANTTALLADQQAQAAATAGQLRGMWLAAANALGAQQALKGWESGMETLNGLEQLWIRQGKSAEEQAFLKAEYLQRQNELIQYQIDAPRREAEAIKAQTQAMSRANDAAAAGSREALTAGDKLARQVGSLPASGREAGKAMDALGDKVRDALNAGSAASGQSPIDTLLGKVQGVLSGSLSLDVGMDPAAMLPREDAINENARRLAAIMNEGLANQPWLEEFKAEVPQVFEELAASGDPKAAAARMMQEFQQGLRPELIDKEAVKERVKTMLVGDANMAALAQEIAAELAQELGVSLGQAQQAVQAALGVQANGAPGNGLATGDLQAGLVSAADGKAMVEQIAGQMDAASDRMRQAGVTAGTSYGLGFMAVVETSLAGPLIGLLVTLVTPGVLAQLAAKQGQAGAKP